MHLLQKSGIEEGKGYGGFPVSGLFLRNTNEITAAKHNAKVYGQASVGAPPMSVPHLDTSKEFLTRKPTVQDMEDKVMATGKIVPKEEIEIKPNISGIIDQILVKEGDKVAAGQLIATLRIVPSVADVNNAQYVLERQKVRLALFLLR